MELPALFEMLVKNWGPQAGLFAIMLWVIIVLARKYDAAMNARISEGIKMALTIQDLTKTMEAMREVIRDRKP